ncbi:MAG: hypothetical protein HOM55_03860 [Proteobacteria bacterium]|nr:hypothetical protein [Pseudomonadota bacterium]
MKYFGLFIGFVLLSTGAQAHHSFGAFYDMNRLVELEGEIVSVFWRNPHVRFGLQVTNDEGSESIWEMEAGSVNTLQRYGVNPDVLRVGENLRVAGPASRHGLNSMFAVSIYPPDESEIILNPNIAARMRQGGSARLPGELAIAEDAIANARTTARGIFRVWRPVSRPNTGSGLLVWPLTLAGQAARDAWDPLIDDPALRCIPPGVPVAMDNPYPIEFTDNGDTIVMHLEEWDGVRTIHMNPDAERPELDAPHMGYSVGRWQENTLLVTTSDVEYPFFDDVGTPQSPDAQISERFTLSADGTRLDWEATVTDPINFTEPVSLSGYWRWMPGEQIKPYECTLQATAE